MPMTRSAARSCSAPTTRDPTCSTQRSLWPQYAKGRITSLDTRAASAVPGVRLILTHENLGHVKSAGFVMAGGYAFQSLQPMLSPAIAYRGQPIALVVADTLETAIEAAELIRATYATEPASVTLDAPGAETVNQADTPLKNFVPRSSPAMPTRRLRKRR